MTSESARGRSRLTETFRGGVSLEREEDRVRVCGCRHRDRGWASVRIGLALCAVLAASVLVHGQSGAQSNRHRATAVESARKSWEARPPEFRKRTSSCLHYLDEADTFERQGEELFVAASQARSSPEQSKLTRQANDAMIERTRLIKEFWACTRRMITGDEFHSQDPPRKDPPPDREIPPPDDPVDPPLPADPAPKRPTYKPPVDPPDPPMPPPSVPRPPPAPPSQPRSQPKQPPKNTPRPSTPPQPETVPVIVALGDDMTAGYKLPPDQKYPYYLQQRLVKEGYRYRVNNAGKVRDTAANVRARLDSELVPNTKIVILAVGLNDWRAKRSIYNVEEDIKAIIEEARGRGIAILFCPFVPPTMTSEYDLDFDDMMTTLSEKSDAVVLENMMSIVWTERQRYTFDNFNPNAPGARVIARVVFRALRPMLGPPSTPAPTPTR
jgi:acyl-CoA thioesterase I